MVLPPVSAHRIIKPHPHNSLLITMTHFPSILRAALSDIIYHRVLKRAEIVLFLSSPLSFPTSLHVSISSPTINLFLLYNLTHTHTHTSQPSRGCRKEGVRKRTDLTCSALHKTHFNFVQPENTRHDSDVHVTIMGLDIDHLLATA